jgi:hypothetical protein
MGAAAGRCTIGIRLLTPCICLLIGFAADDHLDYHPSYTGHDAPSLYFNGIDLRLGSRQLWSADQDLDTSAANTSLWLRLDVDTGEVRLRVNEHDYGVIHILAPGFAPPVHPHPIFNYLRPGEAFELLAV